MALFRPTPKKTEGLEGTSKYSGVCEIGIVNFEDKSENFDWADIYIDIECALKDSKYTRTMQLVGELEREASGKVTGGSVLDRVYRIFDAIGCTAGINIDGEWEDEQGNPIQDIAAYLNTHHCSNFMPDTPPVLDFVGYVYKKKNPKTETVFNTMLTKLYPNTTKGIEDMASYVKWMQKNGFLKEVTDAPTSNTVKVSAEAL